MVQFWVQKNACPNYNHHYFTPIDSIEKEIHLTSCLRTCVFCFHTKHEFISLLFFFQFFSQFFFFREVIREENLVSCKRPCPKSWRCFCIPQLLGLCAYKERYVASTQLTSCSSLKQTTLPSLTQSPQVLCFFS